MCFFFFVALTAWFYFLAELTDKYYQKYTNDKIWSPGNVTNAAKYYQRMKRLSIDWRDAGTPPLCSATLHPPTPSTKRKKPIIDPPVDVDKLFKDQQDIFLNFTADLDEFIHINERATVIDETDPPPTTEPEPTLMWSIERRWFDPDPPYKQV